MRNVASMSRSFRLSILGPQGGQEKVSMSDHDTEILELKTEGKSLREIASVLGVSHEAVRKRLKNLANIEKVSTKEQNQELTASTIKEEKV